MTHQRKIKGSNRTIGRLLMSGAVVSSLLIASMAPASAGCGYPQVTINAKFVDYRSTQSRQLGVNWRSVNTQPNTTGDRLNWSPTDDIRFRPRYSLNGSGGNFVPTPIPNGGAGLNQSVKVQTQSVNVGQSGQIFNRGSGVTFGSKQPNSGISNTRAGIRYDTPNFGSIRIRNGQGQSGGLGSAESSVIDAVKTAQQQRYLNQFIQSQGSYGNQRRNVRIRSVNSDRNMQWGQGLTSFQPEANLSTQVSRVPVISRKTSPLSGVPNLTGSDSSARDRRNQRREVIINVTPHIVHRNER